VSRRIKRVVTPLVRGSGECFAESASVADRENRPHEELGGVGDRGISVGQRRLPTGRFYRLADGKIEVEEGSDPGRSGEIVGVRGGAPSRGERFLRRSIAVAVVVLHGREPVVAPSVGAKAAAPPDGFVEEPRLVPVVGELARLPVGVEVALRVGKGDDALRVEAGDFRRVVDPVRSERKGVGNEAGGGEGSGCHGIK